jgi:hypothetical protein
LRTSGSERARDATRLSKQMWETVPGVEVARMGRAAVQAPLPGVPRRSAMMGAGKMTAVRLLVEGV